MHHGCNGDIMTSQHHDLKARVNSSRIMIYSKHWQIYIIYDGKSLQCGWHWWWIVLQAAIAVMIVRASPVRYEITAAHTLNALGGQIGGQTKGLSPLSGKTSYHKISWSPEAARFGFRLFQSLWNLTGISAALHPRCLSNFRAML